MFFGEFQVYYSAGIMNEYKRVLAYYHLKIEAAIQSDITDVIEEVGTLIEPVASVLPLPDENDRAFYDAAVVSGSILITGNTKHFPSEPFVMTPSDFLDLIKDDEIL